MEAMALFMIAAGALAATAPLTWSIARQWAGDMSAPNWKEGRAILGWAIGGLLAGVVAVAIRDDWVIILVAAFFALIGGVVGGSVGWLTRDPYDRELR